MRLTEASTPTSGPSSWPRVQKQMDASVLPCHNSWLCSVLAQAHFTHYNTMHAHVAGTSVVGTGRRVWQQFLSSIYLLSFWQGREVIGYLASTSRSKIPSGGILDYKVLVFPSSGKCAPPFCYLSSPKTPRGVTDGIAVKKVTLLVGHRFAILS